MTRENRIIGEGLEAPDQLLLANPASRASGLHRCERGSCYMRDIARRIFSV